MPAHLTSQARHRPQPDEIDATIAKAVKGLRACGYSWAEIGSRLGTTRQAAQQRWGQQ
jgi:hypothetical protein